MQKGVTMGEQAPKSILRRLRAAGYEAWYVGGCVRDTLLGRPVHDWDITTSALPQEVTALFAKTIPTGIRHGTVTVLEDGAKAEVTTYRADGQYLDGRHPAAVTFVRSLPEPPGGSRPAGFHGERHGHGRGWNAGGSLRRPGGSRCPAPSVRGRSHAPF